MSTYHIYNVTPTPVMVDGWSGTPVAHAVTRSPSCPGPTTLLFFPWLPFGLNGSNNDYPDGESNNQCYSGSPANPNFWGWGTNFALFSQVVHAAWVQGLTVEEFDLQNEVDLFDFPVEARLIYDNTTGVEVLWNLDGLMSSYGFGATAVTTSVTNMSPNETGQYGNDCGSIYGDSAMFLHLSGLLAAVSGYYFGGTAGQISQADGSPGGMWCYNPAPPPVSCGPPQNTQTWSQCVTQGMVSIPYPQALPSVLDIHSTPSCILTSQGACDRTNGTTATTQAKTFSNDFWALMSYHAITGAKAMFGELPNNQPSDCDGEYPVDAQWSVAGYLASSLYTNAGSHTVLRPWENSVSSCYQIPATIGAPSGPY